MTEADEQRLRQQRGVIEMTMTSKRIERGQTVDVFDLYNGTAAQVEARKDAAK